MSALCAAGAPAGRAGLEGRMRSKRGRVEVQVRRGLRVGVQHLVHTSASSQARPRSTRSKAPRAGALPKSRPASTTLSRLAAPLHQSQQPRCRTRDRLCAPPACRIRPGWREVDGELTPPARTSMQGACGAAGGGPSGQEEAASQRSSTPARRRLETRTPAVQEAHIHAYLSIRGARALGPTGHLLGGKPNFLTEIRRR